MVTVLGVVCLNKVLYGLLSGIQPFCILSHCVQLKQGQCCFPIIVNGTKFILHCEIFVEHMDKLARLPIKHRQYPVAEGDGQGLILFLVGFDGFGQGEDSKGISTQANLIPLLVIKIRPTLSIVDNGIAHILSRLTDFVGGDCLGLIL